MASPSSSSTDNVPNYPIHPTHNLLTVNLSHITKLNNLNYLTWKLQVTSFLKGFHLHVYIDDQHSPPPPTLSDSNEPNPAYTAWDRQDYLLFSALLGSLSPFLQLRGHLKQLKDQLRCCTKGNATITDFLQSVSTKADALAMLRKSVDTEDLTELVLVCLPDEYRYVAEAIHARDTPITFTELHEKLVNWEASLLHTRQPLGPFLPVTMHPTAAHPRSQWRSPPAQQPPLDRPSSGPGSTRPTLPWSVPGVWHPGLLRPLMPSVELDAHDCATSTSTFACPIIGAPVQLHPLAAPSTSRTRPAQLR